MSLASGTRLGPYEILSALGAGGMGEVYRATDTSLGRQVAIKVLPDAFAQDVERLARFEREAKTLAALNHPHIAQIYGLEKSSGVQALVMELVEGEDLSKRIARSPIPVDEALPIAKQIAEALEAAHEQGIIHRDLKPANIKVTPDGVVKVLDFGLAKLNDPNVSNGPNGPNALSMSPTITSPAMMTGVGVLLGTAAYMSPEQAKGREADKRSDLWAFGAVLYEMLTGGRAFDGEDVTDVLVAVLSKEPTWSALPASVPPGIRMLVRRCLQKDKTLRLQAAGDARVEIHEAQSLPLEPNPKGKGRSALGWGTAAAVGLGCLVLGALVAGPAVWILKPAPVQSVIRLAVPLPSGERLAALNTPVLALSPDGSQIAFVSARDGARQIYVRAFGSTESRALPGTEGAESPFFSPDGQWLGFVAGGNLMKVSMGGGVPLAICKAVNTVEGVSWGDDGTIVFAQGYGTSGLSQVSAAGGAPQAITSKDSASEEEADRWPQLLPGGKAVLFTAWSRNVDDAQIVVQRLDTGERRVIVRGGTYARYISTGQVIYARTGTLMAVPFDLSRLETAGTPIPVAQGVSLTTEGAAQFDVSRTGSLVYVPGGVQGNGRTLVWVDRAGKEQLVEAPPRNYTNPRISPDGQQIAVTVQGANDDIWVYDIPGRTLSRLTFEARSLSPTWTPDGKRVIYRSARDGHLNLFATAADGSGKEERLTVSQDNQVPQSVSPDGQVVVFVNAARNGRDLWVLPFAGDRKPRPFIESRFDDGPAAISPDGHWLAYHSDESGRSEVYVQPFPAGGRKVQISRDGGQDPRWAGSELFYRSGAKLVAVHVTTQPTLALGPPQLVFDRPEYASGLFANTFDVSADGQRALMIKDGEQAASATQINVVLNWAEELKRVVSTR